jgi:dihydrofolate reductase
VTHDRHFTAVGCTVVHSIKEALDLTAKEAELCVIGGAQLLVGMLDAIQQIHLTVIHEQFDGDVFFPELEADVWKELMRETHQPDAANHYSYSYLTLERQL